MSVPENEKDEATPPPLTAEKHPQGDLFVCDVTDAILKDIMPQMEHPFYSLSKKPDMKIRRYEHNGNWLEIIPSYLGLATIYDKDILIYCISTWSNRSAAISRSALAFASQPMICCDLQTAGYRAVTTRRYRKQSIAWPAPGSRRTSVRAMRNSRIILD